LLQAWTDP